MTDAWSLLQAACALALVGALFWYGRNVLFGSRLFARGAERMHVEERIALDLRNALVIVRVEEQRLLLALGPTGPARLIRELGPARDRA